MASRQRGFGPAFILRPCLVPMRFWGATLTTLPMSLRLLGRLAPLLKIRAPSTMSARRGRKMSRVSLVQQMQPPICSHRQTRISTAILEAARQILAPISAVRSHRILDGPFKQACGHRVLQRLLQRPWRPQLEKPHLQLQNQQRRDQQGRAQLQDQRQPNKHQLLWAQQPRCRHQQHGWDRAHLRGLV